MANTGEQVRILNQDILPDGLHFPIIGKDENNRLAAFDEEGNKLKGISDVGDLLLKTLVTVEAAEEVHQDGSDATIAGMQARLDEMEKRLRRAEGKGAGTSGNQNDDPGIEALIQQKVDERTSELSDRLDKLEKERDELSGKVAGLETELDHLKRLNQAGFRLGEAVGLQDADDEEWYYRDYEILGISDDDKIRIKNTETGEEDEVERDRLLHEHQLADEDEEEDLEESEFNPDDEVALRQKDGKYKPGYKVMAETDDDDEGLIEVRNEATGHTHKVHPSLLKKTSDLNPDETTQAIPDRQPYTPRESLLRRIRNATPWAAESRDWYVDDRGPYYLDDDGREVYVDREEVRGRNIGAATLVAGGVVGIAAWELIGERILGIGEGSSHSLKEVVHEQAIENARLNGINNHLSAVNDHLTAVDKDITAVNSHLSAVDKHIHNELWHDHKHELRKITAYGNALEHLERREQSGVSGFRDHLHGTGAYWSFRYPWDWAANKVGVLKAENWLHSLASKAAAHGHKVRWIFNGYEPNGSRREILQVDGTTNTQKVLSIVNQYR